MGTVIRAKLSPKNKYWIEKHRYYELKHFCLQYPIWKKAYEDIADITMYTTSLIEVSTGSKTPSDIVARNAIDKTVYSNRIDTIEKAAYEADSELSYYILRGVTEELSFTYLKSRLGMPCSKDTYYDRYRRFFWILSKVRL
ncbi:hypothetical protein [[Clostridium] innocuum]|uniref:hypothetical protein n=1 Tax=Clostridium innocuum TaxID=1522 RepID=UPI001AF85EDC|nr:hypothetical protein [[Clostridium] innocuum]QSI27830.1 hypothetical protein GKZ87_21150 [Erysipelotrichaceae bacterium 66202529]DAU14270.1 MAG TPA: hypothetical protein [Caudoviricetes sp.]MCC2832057.1 hypothetical protein [[Clostridium] innocuum]MCR0246983.1 hypothetical protein [[Clostridium] innocuum]MCR0258345.1 hypothetical protein [[Clostridium] innocuum]